jgi:hypothetical protein
MVVVEIAVMLVAEGRRHQHLDVIADDLRCLIPEQLLAGRVEHRYRAARVDQDHAVDRRIDHRAQLRGAFAQRLLGALALGQVMDDADEDRAVILRRLADGEVHRKRRAVLASPENLAADADDLAFARPLIVVEIAVVLAAEGLGHEHLDVLPDHLRPGIAEQALAGGVEHDDGAARVDQDHAVDGSVDDRAQPGLVLAVGHCNLWAFVRHPLRFA